MIQKKSFFSYILLWCLLCIACDNCKEKKISIQKKTPLFRDYCMSESDTKSIKRGHCIITGFDWRAIHFHVASNQSYTKEFCGVAHQLDDPKKGGYVQINEEKGLENWFLTPTSYGIWNWDAFDDKYHTTTQYQWGYSSTDQGITKEAIQQLLAMDQHHGNYQKKDIVLVFGTGRNVYLGINTKAVEELDRLKNKNEIGDYFTGNTQEAIIKHNEYVESGKHKVFTFLHTAG